MDMALHIGLNEFMFPKKNDTRFGLVALLSFDCAMGSI